VRLRGLAIALPCMAVLAVAAWMTPSPLGHGTHEQLGFQPCSFMVRTGYPCPSCGMTTSVSASVHLQLAQAWHAQPAGLVLAAALVVFSAVGLYEGLSGRAIIERLRPSLWWIPIGIVTMCAGWGVKVLTGLMAGEYPLH
jgi:hypothetical protein